MLQENEFITIDNRVVKCKKKQNKKVDDIVLLVNENKNLLKCVSYLSARKELLPKGTFDMDKQTRKALETLIKAGKINETEAKKFEDKWMTLTHDDIGELLEAIVVFFGPYKYKFNQKRYSLESKIYEVEENNNFDVIFYDYTKSKQPLQLKGTQKIKVSGELEFHECKKNVSNVIPYDESKELADKDKKKFDFMKKINEIVSNSQFFIPTFSYNVDYPQKYLKNNNYGFIHIVSVKELIEYICH